MPYIGRNHIAGDHTSNFKVLDDISSYTATFNGSLATIVSTTDNTIRVPEHRFIQGQRVTYSNGGGGNIGGLTNETAYFITFDTANTFKLATSLANANNNTNINLSSVGTGSSHTLTAAFDGVNTTFKITHGGGLSADIVNSAQLQIAINNVIQKANIDSSYTEGFRVVDNRKIQFKTAPTSNDIFWGNIIANTIETFDITDLNIDQFTGDGVTTQYTLSREVPNNQSVMVTLDGVVQHPSDKDTTRAYRILAEKVIEFSSPPPNPCDVQIRHLGFAGAATGEVSGFYGRTGNVVLGASDHITTGDITSRNINASGIVTASSFSGGFSGNIVGTSATFTGNLSVGGVLTYEDVTNVDSIGIITARSQLNVGNNIKLGNAGVITATSFVGDGSGLIGVASTDNIVTGTAATFTGGVDINSDLDVDGHTNLDNVNIAGVTTMTGVTNLSSELRANGNIRMTNAGPKISFIDSNHDSDFHIENADGSFEIRDVTNGADRVRIASNGTISLLSNVNVSGDLDVDGHTNLDNVSIAGVVTATSFSGDGSNLTGITGTTINNNADNRIITGSGSANTLNGESNLTYDGNNINLAIDNSGEGLRITATGNYYSLLKFDSNVSSAGGSLCNIQGHWNGTEVANIIFAAGDDTSNKDDGFIKFLTTPSGGSSSERLRITPEGYLKIVDNGVQQTNTTLSYQYEGGFLTHYVARTTAGGDRYRRMLDIASVGANPHGSSIRLLTSPDDTNPATTVERVRIDHNGRVGINKSQPATMLSIKAERSAVPRFGIDGHYSDSSYTQSTWDDSNGLYTVLGVNHKLDANGNDATPVASLHSSSIMLDGRAGNIRFYVKPDSGTTFTEAMRINDNKTIDVKQQLNVNYAVSGSDYIATFINQNANCYGVNIKTPNSANAGYPLLSVSNSSGGSHFRVDSGGLVYANSGTGTEKPAYFVRAWVQGDGSGNTNGSGGLSSMSRVSTGMFQLNFSTTMPNDDFAVGCLANNNYTDTSWFNSNSTSSVRVYFYSGGSYQNPSLWSAWVIG